VSAAIVFAVLPTRDDALLAASVGSALLLVPGLAIIHARAARLDPIEIAVRSSWPEPRLASGLTPTIVGWIVAVAIVGALAAPAAPSVERIGADVIEQAYAPYDDACSSDGALAESQSFCDELTSQQRTITRVVDDYAAELLAGLLAAFAFGAAATAHLIVLVRARRISDRIRPRWPLAQLELHWAFAYVLAAGLGAWLLAGSGDSVVSVAGRSLGVAAATIGALAVVSQGLGMSAWMLASRPRPIWFKVLLVAAFVLATPFVLVMLFVIGVLDLAVHPRRRAMASAAD
jgi:hypothetical protein